MVKNYYPFQPSVPTAQLHLINLQLPNLDHKHKTQLKGYLLLTDQSTFLFIFSLVLFIFVLQAQCLTYGENLKKNC